MSKAVDGTSEAPRQGRTPMCSRCRNHGLLVPVRGHSGHCEWKDCSCPKCDLIVRRRRILAAQRQLCDSPATPEESGEAAGGSVEAAHAWSPPGAAHAVPALPTVECMPNLDYYEQETTRMYFGQQPIYRYPGLPVGFSFSGFRGVVPPASPGFTISGMRPYLPIQDRGARDFQGQDYYPPMPSFITPRYLPGVHYMPTHMPVNTSMMAETSRNVSGAMAAGDQSHRL